MSQGDGCILCALVRPLLSSPVPPVRIPTLHLPAHLFPPAPKTHPHSQFVAQHMSEDEVRGLRALFESIDTDGSGTITLDELRQGLLSRGVKVPEQILQQIMDLADLNHNRVLDYDE